MVAGKESYHQESLNRAGGQQLWYTSWLFPIFFSDLSQTKFAVLYQYLDSCCVGGKIQVFLAQHTPQLFPLLLITQQPPSITFVEVPSPQTPSEYQYNTRMVYHFVSYWEESSLVVHRQEMQPIQGMRR